MYKNFKYKDDVSLTARGVAYLRSFSDIRFAKEINDIIEGKTANRIIMGDDFEAVRPLIPLIELRYKSINRAIEIYGSSQILEIASGFSPRGIEFVNNSKNIKYIETDLADLIKEKKSIVKKISVKNKGHLFLFGIDDLNYYQFLKRNKIFVKKLPVTIISEGLLAYFDSNQKKILLNNIYKILKEYGGIWITSDIPTKERVKLDERRDRNVRERANRISKSIKRKMENNLFKNEIEALDFFHKNNFNVEIIKQTDLSKNISSFNQLGLKLEDFKSIFSRRKILVLKPKI